MLKFLYSFFFGCFHERTTFPMTVSSRSPVDGELRRRTYVTCLECGGEYAYNWEKMTMEGRCSTMRAMPAAVVVSIASKSAAVYESLLPTETRAMTRAGAGR